MIHNDILRRLRYALKLDDKATISIFKLVNYDMEPEYLTSIMKKEQEPGFTVCRDKILSLFLDGLIIKNRGKQKDKEPEVLKTGQILTNNEILRKIRIAMTYKDDDIIELLQKANFKASKNEISALFRSANHRNYKECGDQFLRNFLQGMVKKYRPEKVKSSVPSPWGKV